MYCTIDAMGCQTDIAAKIIEKGADYILAAKGNQGLLEEGMLDTIKFSNPISEFEESDFGHGRIENRKCSVFNEFSHIENVSKWMGLKSVVKIEATRIIKKTGKEEKETRCYISSIGTDAKKLTEAIREHWGIENELHWVLDVSFGEGQSMKHNEMQLKTFQYC